jgi:hypothetical protein
MLYFSADGRRVITCSDDHTARIWDVKADSDLTEGRAESLSAIVSGARLDPDLSSLQQLPPTERYQLWQRLAPAMTDSTDWTFVAKQTFPQDVKTALISPKLDLTVRETATRLIGSFNIDSIRKAAASDPTHPVLPFRCFDFGPYPSLLANDRPSFC